MKEKVVYRIVDVGPMDSYKDRKNKLIGHLVVWSGHFCSVWDDGWMGCSINFVSKNPPIQIKPVHFHQLKVVPIGKDETLDQILGLELPHI